MKDKAEELNQKWFELQREIYSEEDDKKREKLIREQLEVCLKRNEIYEKCYHNWEQIDKKTKVEVNSIYGKEVKGTRFFKCKNCGKKDLGRISLRVDLPEERG